MNLRPALPLLLAAALCGVAVPAGPAGAAGVPRRTELALLLGDTEVARFQEGSLGGAGIEIVPEKPIPGDPVQHKRAGTVKFKNIVLKRGLVVDDQLQAWFDAAAKGDVQRKSGSVILLDRRGNEVLRVNFKEAFPTAFEAGACPAATGLAAVESFVLACGSLERGVPAGAPAVRGPTCTVEIDGVPVAGVRAVSPGSVTITDGGVGTPAVVDAGNITLALDPGADPSIHAWFRDLAAGKDIRKSITVILRVPRQPERRYTYHECWPCRWESAVLDSGSDTFIVEELEFAVERVERG